MTRCCQCGGPHRTSEVPECAEKWRAYMRAYHQRPEVKEKQRAYMRAYNQRPDVKEKRRVYNQRPDVKEKKRVYYQRPDVKERMRELLKIRRRGCRLLLQKIENPPADPESIFNEESMAKILGPEGGK